MHSKASTHINSVIWTRAFFCTVKKNDITYSQSIEYVHVKSHVPIGKFAFGIGYLLSFGK